MKYRRLSKEQLDELHTEFARFLATQGIDRPFWERIKVENKPLAEEQLDLFSDLIWENVLQKVQYLEKKEPQWLFLFKIEKHQILLIVVQSKNQNVDLSTKQGITWLLQNLTQPEIEIFTSKKHYQTNRNLEIFKLIEQGNHICKGEIFKYIQKMLP